RILARTRRQRERPCYLTLAPFAPTTSQRDPRSTLVQTQRQAWFEGTRLYSAFLSLSTSFFLSRLYNNEPTTPSARTMTAFDVGSRHRTLELAVQLIHPLLRLVLVPPSSTIDRPPMS
ncbi:unnamed protein product, partial [Scytosiphon promiscuus]